MMSDHECKQGESANRGCCGKCSQPQQAVPQEALACDSIATAFLVKSVDLEKQSVAEIDGSKPD
jgi:hypothetical protein